MEKREDVHHRGSSMCNGPVVREHDKRKRLEEGWREGHLWHEMLLHRQGGRGQAEPGVCWGGGDTVCPE